MMAGLDHSAWKFRPAPLFKSAEFKADEAPPFQRASLAGYAVDDLVWVSTPGQPGVRRAGKVASIFQKSHLLLIRLENPATHIQLNPLVHGALVSKRHAKPADEGGAA